MVVVPKTDRSIWLCIDYLKVNEITTFNAFPMLQVNDMMEKVGQAKITLLRISTISSSSQRIGRPTDDIYKRS